MAHHGRVRGGRGTFGVSDPRSLAACRSLEISLGRRRALSGAPFPVTDRTRGITMQTMMDAKRREDEAATPMDAIAACVAMHDATSRWPGYADQAAALITALAAEKDIETYLRAELGFDFDQVLDLEVAAGRILKDRVNEHGERTAESSPANSRTRSMRTLEAFPTSSGWRATSSDATETCGFSLRFTSRSSCATAC
jgi:hypothetical protein